VVAELYVNHGVLPSAALSMSNRELLFARAALEVQVEEDKAAMKKIK
jgi:hypothetical protein